MINYIIYRRRYENVPENLSFLCQLLLFSVPLLNINLGWVRFMFTVMVRVTLSYFISWFWLTLTQLLLRISLDDRGHLIYSSELSGWQVAKYKCKSPSLWTENSVRIYAYRFPSSRTKNSHQTQLWDTILIIYQFTWQANNINCTFPFMQTENSQYRLIDLLDFRSYRRKIYAYKYKYTLINFHPHGQKIAI